MTLLLPFRRPLLGASWCRNVLWRNAKATPSLDLDFATRKSLADGVTGRSFVDFTRASSGTYVGSDGLIKTATTNLVTFSEQFNNAAWNKYGASVTANAVASPTGSSNASKLVEDTSAGGHGIYRSATVATGLSYVWSGYFKAAERSIVQLKCQATGNVYLVEINLSNQTATTRSGNGTTTITDVGNGWYRVVSIATSTASGTGYWEAILCSAANTASYTGDGTSGIYIWGAQLEQSSTVGEYIPTTSTINSAPRFDHNPTTGESLGLLVEEQRTNSIRNNTMVGAVAGTPGTLPTNWSISSSVNGLTRTITEVGTVNGINYIDVRFAGTATATGNLNYLNDSSITAPALNGQTWTFSSWVSYTKTSGADPVLRLEIDERDSAGNFLAATQTIILPNQVLTRYSTTRINNNALTAFELAYIQAAYVSGQSYDFTLRIGLPQLEQGAFATSVIPTTGTAVTRSADVASITGANFSSWYNQTEGTVFAEFNRPAVVTGLRSIAAVSDSGFNNRMTFRTDSAVVITSFVITGSVNQASFPLAINSGAANKAALAYATNDFNAGVNGVSGTNDTVGTVPVVDRLSIGSVLNAEPSCSYVRRLTYWPSRLPNATLQQITQ